MIASAVVVLPLIALWVAAIERGRAAEHHPATERSGEAPSTEQFVFTHHFFIAGLIEGPYTFQLPRGDDPPSSDT